MTSTPPHDPLVALWHTTQQPDTDRLLQGLQRFNRLHQRINRSVMAILWVIAVLLLFEETTGRVATHGFLSAIWIGGVAMGSIRHRRARSNRLDALTLDTVSLLKALIARAKSDLLVARCLYAGAPLGAAISFTLFKLAGVAGSTSGKDINPALHLIQTGASIAALILMVVVGIVLARSGSRQVQDLSEKLKWFEADL